MTRKERKEQTQLKIKQTAGKYWDQLYGHYQKTGDFNSACKYCDDIINVEMIANPQDSHILKSAGYMLLDWLESAYKEYKEQKF